ncbi:bZIP transcription factor family protein [Cucumis melo var. makuwa]|uniref:BZIP transcription factor family protein n=1 Tax=Cucumis melo var. makuwa TaxID=1194695 RepID=A0A5D3DNR8_CUCMM|nr:bZIP transcription factor family protein [Cucumis melo var. makuwa]
MDKEAESSKVSPASTTSYQLFGCRRSRRNLTEAEKEERRIRRILANRESARQTIRRRQALCEELTRKAADLAWENENLKREKELALKEYQSLETTNKELKEQLAEAVKPKVEEIPGNHIPSHVQMPPLPSNCPLFLFSRFPYFWPSVVQSTSSYHELPNVIVVPSSINLPANNNASVSGSSQTQENFTNVTGSRAPFCMLPPCSWLLPHHDFRNQQSPQIWFPAGNDQEDIYSKSQDSAITSKVVHAESRHSAEEENDAPDLNEAPSLDESSNPKDDTQNTVGVAVEGFDTNARAPVRKVLSPVRLECIEPSSAAKLDNWNEDDHGVSSRTCDDLCYFAERRHEPEIVPCKKSIDAMAATEARRRRKELTKVKNLYARQCQAGHRAMRRSQSSDFTSAFLSWRTLCIPELRAHKDLGAGDRAAKRRR